jgi:hypothetical protein
MDARCNTEKINFWPVGLEGDGAPTPQFELPISSVCDAAVHIKGLTRSSFKTDFQSRIANALAQCSARLSLQATSCCRASIFNEASSAIHGRVNDGDFSIQPQNALPACCTCPAVSQIELNRLMKGVPFRKTNHAE